MKKSNKRSKTKYPGLDKNLNLRVRKELIDYDYINKLSEKDKEWLNRFTEEYVSGKFEKTEDGEWSKENLHKGKMRNDCWDRNNWRNNDVYAVEKAKDMLKDSKKMTTHLEKTSLRTPSEIEDILIEEIDKEGYEN